VFYGLFHCIFFSAFCWEKYGILNTTCHENLFTGSPVVRQRWTDMEKLRDTALVLLIMAVPKM